MLIIIFGSCYRKISKSVSDGALKPLSKKESVIVFDVGELIPDSTKLIGTIEIRETVWGSNSTFFVLDYQKAVKKAKKLARKAGANIVQLTDVKTHNVQGDEHCNIHANLLTSANKSTIAEIKSAKDSAAIALRPVWHQIPGRMRNNEYPDTPRNNFDLQLLGPALGLSANYERRFIGTHNEFAIRTGVGYSWGDTSNHSRHALTFPIQGVFRLGNKSNHVEIGAGVTYMHIGKSSSGEHYSVTSFFDFFVPATKTNIFLPTLSAGGRFPIFLTHGSHSGGRTDAYIAVGMITFYGFHQFGLLPYFSYGLTF